MVHGMQALNMRELPSWLEPDVTHVGPTQNGARCMVYQRPEWRKTKQLREFVVTWMTQREWKEVLAAVPTCGNHDCGEPAHLCVTFRT